MPRLQPKPFKVPKFIVIATTEKSGNSLTMEFLADDGQEMRGNKSMSVDNARKKMMRWANERAKEGDTVFIYTVTSTVVEETHNLWEGELEEDN